MSDAKKTSGKAAVEELSDALDAAVDAAMKQANDAQKAVDVGSFSLELSAPLEWEGRTYEKLVFQWDALTGEDYLDIENEMMVRGKTLVMPEYTGDFLLGMAVRACTERNEKGVRVLTAGALKRLPLGDFIRIVKKARTFLLRTGR